MSLERQARRSLGRRTGPEHLGVAGRCASWVDNAFACLLAFSPPLYVLTEAVLAASCESRGLPLASLFVALAGNSLPASVDERKLNASGYEIKLWLALLLARRTRASVPDRSCPGPPQAADVRFVVSRRARPSRH